MTARQVVVLHRRRDHRDAHGAIHPGRDPQLELDRVGERRAQSALHELADLIGKALFELERDEDLTIADQRTHAKRFGRGGSGKRQQPGDRDTEAKTMESQRAHSRELYHTGDAAETW